MKKNIGFLIADIGDRGGTERVTSMIANGFIKNDRQISIISCRNGERSYFSLDTKIVLYSLHGERFKNCVRRKLNCYSELEYIVKEQSIEIMIAVDVALYFYLWPLQKLGLCKCIAWEHFNYFFSYNKLVKLGRWLSAKQADCVVVLGKADYENYKKHYRGIKRIEYIYNPVAFSEDKSANIEEKRVMAAGRLTAQKGFDRLIEIWKIIEKDMPDWRLDIFGEGELKEKLLEKIARYNLNNIKIKGYSENLEEEYINSSIFVLTSIYEGFVLVLIEAQAMGIPAVSFNCKEGPNEIIENGINGYLVKDGDISGFAEKLKELMVDYEKRIIFSKKTKIHLNRFKIDVVMDQWIQLLDTI